ncbi:MAG: DUF4902 domain-containing protein [Rudaea sp.]
MQLPTNVSTVTNLVYAQDGYIRLTYQHFCSLRFSKRITFNDDDLRQELLAMDLPATEAGYCEWLDADHQAQISIGWAWFTSASDAVQRLAPGGISCNVMLTSADGNDLGSIRTGELLNRWLSNCAWREHRHFDTVTRLAQAAAKLH